MNDYMTDDELLEFIADIEQNDMVKAPPHIKEDVLMVIGAKEKEADYKKFRGRVIIAVAAILLATLLMPIWTELSEQRMPKVDDKYLSAFYEIMNGHYISDLMNGREE